MVRIITQNFRNRNFGQQNKTDYSLNEKFGKQNVFLSRKAKFLAWSIFLIFFIENGTLGLFPKQYYFVYRNIRLSDFIMYAVIIYSLFCIKEYYELYSSRSFVIVKLLLAYLILQFIGSAIFYDYNSVVEFFFRMKSMWFSFMVFPFMLLIKRKALPYLITIIFPFAIIANILYIISSVTGVAMMPDINIIKQNLPGGLEVYRVYGGTFYGELFFLGFVYQWITQKFRLHQLFFAIFFIIPHILAFGRSAWFFFLFVILFMNIWNLLKKKDLKIIIRQVSITIIFAVVLFYAFIKFIPRSEYITEALGSRIEQGQEDIEFKEGTFGTRLLNITALLELWLDNNLLIGIGMHPMWVIKPVTAEESIYSWGFSDIGWTSVLAAYGLIGFTLAIIFQIYYIVTSFKVLKHNIKNDLLIFFILILISRLFYDSFINYTYILTSVGLYGIPYGMGLLVTTLIYKYEHSHDN